MLYSFYIYEESARFMRLNEYYKKFSVLLPHSGKNLKSGRITKKSKLRSQHAIATTRAKTPTTTTRRDMTYTPATLDIGQWTNSGRSVDKHDVSEFSIFRLDALCSSSLTPKQRQPFEVQ